MEVVVVEAARDVKLIGVRVWREMAGRQGGI